MYRMVEQVRLPLNVMAGCVIASGHFLPGKMGLCGGLLPIEYVIASDQSGFISSITGVLGIGQTGAQRRLF